MKFLIQYARFFKWLSCGIALAAFAARVYYGELYEEQVTRDVTNETRMSGSNFGIWMVVIIIAGIISFAFFNELSKRKKE